MPAQRPKQELGSIVIVGVGPRGISIIERLAAQLSSLQATQQVGTAPHLTLHLIDDAQLGAGRIWDTTQTRTLCMNTLAGAVTLFTEPGSSVQAPVVEGPTMFEWIQLLRGDAPELSEAKLRLWRRYRCELPVEFAEEVAHTVEESNPSRALYGCYLRWVFAVVLDLLPDWVEVVRHQQRAVAFRDAGDQDLVVLADGSELRADQTVFATGWQRPAFNAEEELLAQAPGVWVRPDNPVEQDLSAVPAGEQVLVRGLGMGFFDVMALLTINRGGRFVEDASTRSGLRYEPSGEEPHLVASSGRGYPYLPKSEYKSLPPRATLARLRRVIDYWNDPERSAQRIDFGVSVWPAIVRDAYEAYYRTLHEQGVDLDLPAVVNAIDAADLSALDEDLAGLVPAEHVFSLAQWQYPLAGFRGSIAELTEHIAVGMQRDIAEAVLARRSPLKAALWEISAARKPASILGEQDRFTYDSRPVLQQFMALGQMVGSGPPLFRTRELLALVDAGLVSFVGARPTLEIGEGFVLRSETTGVGVASSVLIDAWMHSPDVRAIAEPLMLSVGDRIKPFDWSSSDGKRVGSGSPATDAQTRAVIGRGGKVDERLHIVGIPTYAQFADTTISPMPGTDPLMLQETDKVAAHMLTQLWYSSL